MTTSLAAMKRLTLPVLALLLTSLAPARADDLVEQTTNAANTAMRVVVYGIDNELPDKNDLTTAKFLMKNAEDCLKNVEQLLKNPATAGTKLELNGVEEPQTLAEVRDKYCKPAQAAIAPLFKGAVSADAEANKGLSPGRIEALKMFGLRQYTIFGRGGKKLTTNAELQASDLWVVWDEDKTKLVPAWWASIFKWKGDKYEKTGKKGAGGEPPVTIFQ